MFRKFSIEIKFTQKLFKEYSLIKKLSVKNSVIQKVFIEISNFVYRKAVYSIILKILCKK